MDVIAIFSSQNEAIGYEFHFSVLFECIQVT